MRRFLRWAFNFAAAVSAVLCVGLCVLWVRSYAVADRLGNETGPGSEGSFDDGIWRRERSLLCSRGGVQLLDRRLEWLALGGAVRCLMIPRAVSHETCIHSLPVAACAAQALSL